MANHFKDHNTVSIGNMAAIGDFSMNEERFLGLLDNLIGVSKYLQNNPSQGLVPKEDRASDYVLEMLAPYSTKNGGVLHVQRVSFVEGRGNVIIKYHGTEKGKICSFIGSHLDVVPADPKGWERDPFKLVREGDLLYGRGTTDCLGHIALLTDFMAQLGEKKPQLKHTIVVVFIANEENSAFTGIGIDQLSLEGYIDELKAGPVFWIDSADTQPCVGTAGNLQWKLTTTGKLFHSGMPHKGMNAIEMAMDAITEIQRRFYTDFPRHPKENEYNFATQSTLKPCQIACTPGALNQLPPECTVQGDVRLSPFYNVKDVREAVNRYVAEINANISTLENPTCRGPHTKYSLPDESKVGKVEWTWASDGENGVACSLESPGHKALLKATSDVIGDVKPYSIGGSLPLIRELQDNGFDVQISGYGLSSRYHADNEYASLNSLREASKIIAKVIAGLESP